MTKCFFVHEGEKNHVCDICGTAFGTVGNLKNHVERVHEHKRPQRIKNCPCSVCGKLFYTTYKVKVHIRTVHEGIKKVVEKKHMCGMCGNYFATPSHLQTHIDWDLFIFFEKF